MTNPDAVIKIVEFKILLQKSWAEIKSCIWLSFLWGKTASLYTWGNAERLSNISEISKWLLIMSQRKIPESSFSEQHDESDDNQKENE